MSTNNIKYLKDENNNTISPVTSAESVYTGGGTNLNTVLSSVYTETILLGGRDRRSSTAEGSSLTLNDSVTNYELLRFDWYPFQTGENTPCYVTSWCHIPVTGNYQRLQISEPCSGSTNFYNTTISFDISGNKLITARCRYWGSNGTSISPTVYIGTIYGYKHVT